MLDSFGYSINSLVVGQIAGDSLRSGLHALLAGPPACGADFAVLVGELEGLHEPQGLVDVASDGEVVDGDLAQRLLAVDDEQAAERQALVLLNE